VEGLAELYPLREAQLPQLAQCGVNSNQ
jgi:hypothetical protein